MRLAKVFQQQKLLLEGRREYMMFIDAFPFDAFQEPESKQIREAFIGELEWAEKNLKKQDRIIWWLKLVSVTYYLFYRFFLIDRNHKYALFGKWAKKNPNIIELQNYGHDLTDVRAALEHYAQVDYPPLNDFPFTHQAPSEILQTMETLEAKWKSKQTRKMSMGPEETILLSLGEYIWVDVGTPSCEREGKAGGHCGNGGRVGSTDRMYSLRRVLNSEKQYFEATFILNDLGYLTERKGYANEKPSVDTHPAIVEFLKLAMVKGLQYYGHYLPQNDFQISDLSDNLFLELTTHRPDLIDLSLVVYHVGYLGKRLTDPSLLSAFLDRLGAVDGPAGRITPSKEFDADGIPGEIYSIDFLNALSDDLAFRYLSFMNPVVRPVGDTSITFMRYLIERFGYDRLTVLNLDAVLTNRWRRFGPDWNRDVNAKWV